MLLEGEGPMLEDRDLEKIQGMIDASQEKLAGMIGREFLNIHGKFEGMNREFAEVGKRFDDVDKRLDAVETEIKEVRKDLNVGLARLEEQVKQLRIRIESLEAGLVDHRAEHEILELELAGIKKIVQGVEEKKAESDWLAMQETLEAAQQRIGRLEAAVFA
jgi:chromosome segregation ATPase